MSARTCTPLYLSILQVSSVKEIITPLWVSSCIYSKLPQIQWLKNTYLLSYNSGGQKSETGFTELKSRCWHSLIPFWRLYGRNHFLTSSLSTRFPRWYVHGSLLSSRPGRHHSDFLTRYHFESYSIATSPSLTLTLLHPSFTSKAPCGYIGPTQVTQDNIYLNGLNLSAKPLFPYKVTYLQVPGIRIWTSLGDHFFHLPQFTLWLEKIHIFSHAAWNHLITISPRPQSTENL